MFERSFHFVPSHKKKYFANLQEVGADSLVFDLEDGVPIADKENAATWLSDWLEEKLDSEKHYVRINSLSKGRGQKAEQELLQKHPTLGVVLPKIESAKQLREWNEAYRFGEQRRLVTLIESARGLINLSKILSAMPIYAVGLGLEDFLAGTVFHERELVELTIRIRTDIALQCKAAGVVSIDTISMDLLGENSLRQDVRTARSCGMQAKFSIHPKQVKVINQILMPSEETIRSSRRLLQLVNKTGNQGGYSQVEGLMVTPPKIKKALFINRFSKCHEKDI